MKIRCPAYGCEEVIEVPEHSEPLEDKMRINVRCPKNHLICIKIVAFERDELTEREGSRPKKPKMNRWLKPLEYV